jgi:hypothetical protein
VIAAGIIRRALLIAARELGLAVVWNAGQQIGEAIGHRIGKAIDPTWNEKHDEDVAPPKEPKP